MLVSLSAALLAEIVCAQDAEPSPTASPAPISENAPSPQPAMPKASPSPTAELKAPPDLLPESRSLPAQPVDTPIPYDLMPEGTKLEIPELHLDKPSAEQQEEDKVRFRQLRTIAVRNLYAMYLYDRARLTKTEESRREYLRAYYELMCNQMRRVEPRLKATIDAYENLMISRVIQDNIKPTIPVRDLAKFQAEEQAHMQH